MLKCLFTIFCFLFSSMIFAQNAKITGKVITSSGQSVSGATVILLEISKTTVTDQNGSFSFNGLDSGTYSIKCSSINFDEKLVEEIVVVKGTLVTLTISLDEKTKTNEGVVVTSTKVRAARESDLSLIIAQKNSGNVSDGISSESIRKTPDRFTSDVLKRVSGASIQDDRFAIVRGLNDRYNAAFINGAPLPSSESDRKAFAFDIFPSAVLDNLIIYKTATPDLTGEFAGGIINLTTKAAPQQNFTSISFGAGYNTILTGEKRYSSETKGKTDWLGIDDGIRGIPKGLPGVTDIRSANPDVRGELAKLFGDLKWGIKEKSTSPNFNFLFSQGLNIRRKEKDFFGALFSLAYNKTFSLSTGERNTYNYDILAQTSLVQDNKYTDSIFNEEVVLAALGNFSFKINNRNNISFKNNFSINSDNRLIKRSGEPFFDSSPDFYRRDVVRWFTSNQILSSQLIGEHEVGGHKTKINWLAAYSKVKRDIPNLARTSEIGQLPDLTPDISTGQVNLFSGTGSMFWTSNDENIQSVKVDIIQPFKFMQSSQSFVKIGGGYQKRDRTFTSRLLGFATYNSLAVRFDDSLRSLPIDQIFRKENLGLLANGKGGFLISEGTDFTSDYTASSELTHFYAMADQRFFKKFRLIYGARVESFNQKMNARLDFSKFINIDTSVVDVLPSLNFIYSINKKINARLSYSKTLNRPEFREFAPFLFFDYVSQYSYNGFDTLKRAVINNFDLRFEFYPGRAQLFSVSAFYKDFKNPIEIISNPLVTNNAFYYNASSAEVYGVEAEFRTLISTIVGITREKSLLNKFTLSANAALIKSNVKIERLLFYGPEDLITNRALQGQSPYLINGSLGFNDEKLGLSSTVSINRVGDRIILAGTVITPDIYEKARTVFDFQLNKSILKNKLDLRLTVRDILAQNISFYYDFDRSKSYTETDRFLSSSIAPRVITFSATYRF